MVELVNHVALGIAVLAIGGAALRIASLAAPNGLERLVATITLTVALWVVEALGLGLIGLGGTGAMLFAAAVATWAAALVLLPAPQPMLPELAAWWRGLGGGERVAAGAIGGLCAAWVVWQLFNFSIGFDSSLYHYPLVAGWIENGRPGSGLTLSYDIPYANYPLTDEVAQTWAAAIARSWIPLVLWNPALLGVLGVASWLTLRNVAAPRLVALLTTAVLVTLPLVVRQLSEPQTDLPAFAWLVCTAALATSAGRRPALLVPAFLAAGLSAGTKPSTGPLAVATLAVGLYLARGRLRPLAGWLGAGFVGAVAIGGVWYLRNLVEHGSPVWPFAQGPFGDPPPRFFQLVNVTFLQHPGATLDGQVGHYASRLSGGLVVLAGALVALVAAVLARRAPRELRRPLLVAGCAALLGLILWSNAWGTGVPSASRELAWQQGFPLSSLRYMLPAIGAGALALAIAARAGALPRLLATCALVVALSWNLVADARLGPPLTPSAAVLALGAVGGAVAVVLLRLAGGWLAENRHRLPAVPSWSVALGVVVVAGALLAPVSNGIVERSTDENGFSKFARGVVVWLSDQPDGDEPVAIASRGVLAQLAGDHFEHALVLVPRRPTCAEVARLARRGPVVVTDPIYLQGLVGVVPYSGPRCLAHHRPVLSAFPYRVYRLSGAVALRR